MRVYIDGIFDLFHYGHLESFRKCKEIDNNVYLIVGVIGDKVAEKYKRLPIIIEDHRYSIIKSISYVDKIVKNSPLIITKKFMDKYQIDLVIHGFLNKEDANKQDDFFKYPKSVNKFHEIEYCRETSTTEIINKIVESKK
jgi:cytidyltransferase-like protein